MNLSYSIYNRTMVYAMGIICSFRIFIAGYSSLVRRIFISGAQIQAFQNQVLIQVGAFTKGFRLSFL